MKNFQNKEKIIKVSKFIRAVILAGTVWWVVVVARTMFQIPWNDLPPRYANFTHFSAVSGIVFGIMNLMAFYSLFRFFSRLTNGCLFEAPTIRHLDTAGKWLLGVWLCKMALFPIAYGYFGSKAFLPGYEGLLAGLSLACGAWLLKEAQGLQEEQELTV